MSLKELIDSEPLNAARTDQQVLDWLNETVTVKKGITYQDLIVWASENQIGKKIKEAIADEEATPGTWTAGVYNDTLVLDMLLKSGGDVDLSRDDVRAIVGNLDGGGKPLSVPNKAALFAMSDVNQLRWVGTTPDQPSLQMVQNARVV